MKVISVINYKGGVGKTTLTVNLGAELAYRNWNILLLDLDPQASLTFSFLMPEIWSKNFEKDRTIKSWFDSFNEDAQPLDLSRLIYSPEKVESRLRNCGKLHIIPSHLGLINVDLELATELGGGSLRQARKKYLGVHRRLSKGIKSYIDADSYDIVLIDCPPNFNIVTKTAIVASDYLLTPARPDYLSTLGIDYLIRNLKELVGDYNDYLQLEDSDESERIDPKVLGVVFNMVQEYANQPIAAQRQYIRQTKALDIPVFDTYIKGNQSAFASAPEAGIPVVLSRYPDKSRESVVRSLEAVADEFEKRLGISHE
jgi:chromosome partitioning protein